MNFSIREEASSDAANVARVIEEAFEQPDEAELKHLLDQGGDTVLSLVAESAAGELIGHVLFSRLENPERCLALAPVSVRPDAQSRGIGSGLIREGLNRLCHSDWIAVFLLGEPSYYGRFGFSVALAARFDTRYPKDYVQALAFDESRFAALTGSLTYARAFNQI